MNGITLDTDLRSRLGDLSQERNLYDESGRVVARIVPVLVEPFEPPVDEAELNRIHKETTRWYTSEEVFARLRQLEEGRG